MPESFKAPVRSESGGGFSGRGELSRWVTSSTSSLDAFLCPRCKLGFTTVPQGWFLGSFSNFWLALEGLFSAIAPRPVCDVTHCVRQSDLIYRPSRAVSFTAPVNNMESPKTSFSVLTPTNDCPSPDCSSESSVTAAPGGFVGPPSRRRTAEKNRRLTTNTFFDQLVTLLSITGGDSDIHKKQDKASILCNARNFVRFYHDLSTFHGSPSAALPTAVAGDFRVSTASASPPNPTDCAQRQVDPRNLRCHNSGVLMEHLLQTCNGFLLVTVPPGRVMYSSNSLLSSLGVSPSTFAGQLLSNILCQEDVQRILALPSPRQLPENTHSGQQIVAYPRSRARYGFHRNSSITTVGSTPQYFTCSTYLRQWNDSLTTSNESTLSYSHCHILVGTNNSLSFPDSPLAMDEEFKFEMRVSKGGRIIEVQKHATVAIGYTTVELIGASVFDFVHPYHVVAFGEAIQSFTTRGCGSTNLYRFFTKGGQWLWCAARGFIACNPWNHDTDHLVLEIKILGTNQVDSQLRNATDPMCQPRSDEPEWCGLGVAAQPPVAQEVAPVPTTPKAQESTADVNSMQQRLKQLEEELRIKNSALFNSQIQLLEQQNLLNQERKKFFDLTDVLVKELHPPTQPSSTGYSCKDPHHVEASGHPPPTGHYTQALQQAATLPHGHQPAAAPHLHQPAAAPHLHQPTVASHLHQPTVAPHLHQPTVAPHLHQPTVAPHLHQPTVAPHLHQPTVAPYKPSLPPSSMYCSNTHPVTGLPGDKMTSMDTLDLGLDFIAELCGDQVFQTFPTNHQEPSTRH